MRLTRALAASPAASPTEQGQHNQHYHIGRYQSGTWLAVR
jgi:hypothetical protein